MTLLEVWRTKAYGDQLSKEEQEKLWKDYFLVEKGIYEKLLADVSKVERGTVKELAEKYGTDIQTMTGFLDGISESLKQDIPTETMDENTEIVLEIDPEKLYGLEAWDHILSAERRKELYREQKQSGTIRKEVKVGRNDPCPCGSGKKYKYCCGRNA